MLPMSIMFRNQTCLKESVDHQILAFLGSGLIERWVEMFSETIDYFDENETKKLKIDQIVGVIEICVIMYALCVLIFILELLTLKYEAIRKFIDFFTFK